MRTRVLSILVLGLALFVLCCGAGCSGSTDLINGLAPCASSAECPTSYHCAVDGKCWMSGTNPPYDASVPDVQQGCPGALVDCGGGTCIDPRTNPQHCGATTGCGVGGAGSAGTACTNGLACNSGVCSVTCPGTQVNCGGTCVDPTTDPTHCGATAGCGTGGAGSAGAACSNGTVCSAGACTTSCASTETNCSGACVDTTTDPSHCGACATVCALANVTTDACVKSSCAVAVCAAGFGDCDGVASNGCETATKGSDVNNCGGCGVRCQYANASAKCATGTCGLGACNAGFADCDGNPANGCETNTTSDVAHCGACGTACTSGQSCSAGVCAASCGAGLTNCSGSCVNETTDAQHCGSCTNACALANVTINACSASSCVVGACQAGFGDCDGNPANGCETATAATDVNNCGGCGVKCSYPNAGATCTSGACGLGACKAGFADCDGNAANGCETNTAADSANCGACGTVCGGGQVCSAGVCGTTCGAGLTNCSGSCVNEVTDVQHCGSCTTACALPNVSVDACSASTCVVGACAAGYGDCDGVASNGCETATRSTDVNNCGGCGIQCNYPNAAATCATGTCGMGACKPGFADCDHNPANGCEVNTKTDSGNCGACGATCGGGQVCSAGACTTTCGTGLSNCSGSCVNETTDVQHCGGCTTACALPNVSVNACTASNCVVGACTNGYGDCDGLASNGCETATRGTDVTNCGGCGIQCSYPNAGATCSTGTCALGACKAGFANCDGSAINGCEVNTKTDSSNCGGCGTVCGGGQVCSAGVCTTTCGAGLTNCSGSCVNETTDVQHCGSCPNACALANVAINACSASTCVVGACATGYGDCDGNPANGCETATRSTDVNNCGGCAIHCSYPNASASCTTGTCAIGACNAGFANCDGNAANGCEVNTKTDSGNCGGCGTVCGGGQVCSAGVCTTTCGAGLTNCTGNCVNETTDELHCGSCTNSCALANVAVNACSASTCVVGACATGYGDCDGNPANGCETATRSTDVSNCGGCGIHCSYPNAGSTCAAGACGIGSCTAGFANCDGNAANGCEVNTKTDSGNCGGCGTVCGGGQVCSAGVCTTTCGGGLTNCSGNCVNEVTDVQHCGGCATACSLPNVSTNACSGSACVVGACATGYGDCDGLASNGCETATRSTDVNNCGGCGIHCSYPNAGATCSNGTCAISACAPGFADCDGNAANGCEVNTKTDSGNCGGCGTTCGGGQVCSGGSCTTTCGTGLTNCSGNCVNEVTDELHCGSCTTACALPNVAVNACSASTCVVGACATGYGDCDGNPANGCETATRSTDVTNCGGCGVRCSYPNAGATCATGTCGLGACTAGFANCDANAANGCEVNTKTDSGNCGGCGTVCGGGQVCSAGVCTTTCGASLTNCSGSCVNETTDVQHCGSCATACSLPNVSLNACSASNCVVGACAPGYGDCDGVASNGCETPTQSTDVNNCGGCGVRCSYPNAGASCSTGTCSLGSCSAGFADCDHVAANGCEVNTRTDSGNCGGCGTVCGGGQVCSAGVCTTTCGAGLTNCSGSCVNEVTDVQHCGGCATSCALAHVSVNACSSSNCVVGACAAGYGDCDGVASNGCETATLGSDMSNCGGCGIHCSYPNAGASCSTGACSIGACSTGFADCDHNPANGCEVNTRTDSGNCGGCGTTCGGGQVCSAGVCTTTCGTGLANCSGSCVNETTDVQHCGSCANACTLANVAINACASSSCVVGACTPGFGDCDGNAANGCETATKGTDINNCGGCGIHCSYPNAGATCSNGTCSIGSCSAGHANCDGNAANGCEVNTQTDNLNCGGCLTTCSNGQVCSSGACTTTCGTGLTNCSGSCVDVTTSPTHCGACATSCPTPPQAIAVCAASNCAYVCQSGFGDCDFNPANGCELNVTADPNNCGACGHVCPNSGACTAGHCPVLYTISVTVSGLTATGLVLQDNGGDNLTFNASGTLSFATPIAPGGMYGVTVLTEPSGQVCTVAAGSGTANANVTVSVSCFQVATGGTISVAGGYRIHKFTGSGTFQTFGPLNVEYLIVAGGGGGGSGDGAGGGGGGVIAGSTTLGASSFPVVVGGGGAGASSVATGDIANPAAQNGANSTFNGLTALGGGSGGSEDPIAGGPKNAGGTGGSGGGFGGANGIQNLPGGAGTAGQGNNGGTRYSALTPTYYGMGGGGGAGGAGGNGDTSNTGGAGGVGIASSISGTSTYYAGGGGGSSRHSCVAGVGGLGGGGNGGFPTYFACGYSNGFAGTPNTGGGGGGGGDQATTGGNGGSGIVIIRYPYTAPQAPKNCKEYLAANPGAPSGIYTVYPGGSPTLAYCDMTTALGGWTEVLDQDTAVLPPSSTTLANWAGPYNAGSPNNGQYSIMNLLAQLNSGSSFEFLLVYVNNPGGGTFQWTQVENPTTFNSSTTRPTISNLVETNPSPMYDDAPAGQNLFTGLSLTVSGNSYLSGDGRALNAGNWWFAIGEVVNFGNGMPSYSLPNTAPYNGGSGTSHGKLFVR